MPKVLTFVSFVGAIFINGCVTVKSGPIHEITNSESSRCNSRSLASKETCQSIFYEGKEIAASALLLDRPQFVQELLELKKGAPIPSEVYRKYPLRLIGETLVERLRRNFQPAVAGPATYDFSIPEILIFTSGRHLESWGTEAGKGNVYAIDSKNLDEERLDTESKLIGLNMKKIPGDPIERERHLRLLPNYGQLNVALRSEFSELNVRSSEVYGKLSDPEAGGIIAVPHEFVKRRTTFFPMDSNLSLIPVKAQVLGVHKLKPPFLQYVEAEIWGGFGIPDVKEWWIHESNAISAQKLTELKAYGLPIFTYSESPIGQQYHITKKQQVYAGDPAKNQTIPPIFN